MVHMTNNDVKDHILYLGKGNNGVKVGVMFLISPSVIITSTSKDLSTSLGKRKSLCS